MKISLDVENLGLGNGFLTLQNTDLGLIAKERRFGVQGYVRPLLEPQSMTFAGRYGLIFYSWCW